MSGISYLRGKSRQKLRPDHGSCSHQQKPFGLHTSYFCPNPGVGSAKSQTLCTWHFQSIQQHKVAQRHVRGGRRMGEEEKLGSGHVPNLSHLPRSWSCSAHPGWDQPRCLACAFGGITAAGGGLTGTRAGCAGSQPQLSWLQNSPWGMSGGSGEAPWQRARAGSAPYCWPQALGSTKELLQPWGWAGENGQGASQ